MFVCYEYTSEPKRAPRETEAENGMQFQESSSVAARILGLKGELRTECL
jgi:hypothetical protein